MKSRVWCCLRISWLCRSIGQHPTAYHCSSCYIRKEVTGWFTLNSAPHMTMRWSARVVKPVDWKLLNRQYFRQQGGVGHLQDDSLTVFNSSLKITEKVSFNIASEASYVTFWDKHGFWNFGPNFQVFIGKWDILKDFQTLCLHLCLDFVIRL